jgi:tetratricopeptide (TPR) repeat protein
MQDNMIREIEQNPPALLVHVVLSTSWLVHPGASLRLVDWADDYVNQNMQQVGLIQFTGPATREIVWGPDAATTPVHSPYYVAIYQKTDADNLIRQYQAALRLNPDDHHARFYLGVALGKQGRTDEAIRQYQEALRLQPDDAQAHNNLGNQLGKLGRMDEAMAHYQAALRLQPDYAEAHNNLGVAFARQGQADAAIREFQEALRHQPDYADAQKNLRQALALKRQAGPPPASPAKP